ncbi:MAG: lysophospholipid acyltransferase family protein [Kofleriaceae bacterium]
MRRAVLGVFTYVGFAVLLLVWLPVLGLVTLLGRDDLRRRGRWMRRFGRVSARVAPQWRFRVEGPTPPGIAEQPYVVVANHQSTADPWLLSSLPWDMRWIAKDSLFRAPVLGWLMRLGGDLPVVRGDGPSVVRMMAAARATLAGGLSLMVFPEGTRSRDGQLGPFKDGAFELAIGAGVPIVPVVVDGTHKCRPKGSRWFGDADAVARVLAPVPTAGLTVADLPALRERVRDLIGAELARMRAAVPAVVAPHGELSLDMSLPAAVAAAVLSAASAAPRAAGAPHGTRPSADDTSAPGA